MYFKKANRLAAVAALTLGAVSSGLPVSAQAGNPLNNINHIVVIYQENWPFDALYGSFPGANGISHASATSLTQLDKLNGNQLTLTGSSLVSELPQGFTLSNPATYGSYNDQSYYFVTTNPPEPVNSAGAAVDTNFLTSGAGSALQINTLAPYSLNDPALSSLDTASANGNPTNYVTGDIYHRYLQEQFQINGGKNNLFVSWSDDPGLVLSHFDATDLPEGLTAQQYTLCDNYFHSAFGGSFLNHQFLIAAAAPVYPNPPGSILTCVDPTTGLLQLVGVGNPVSLTNLAATSGTKFVTVSSVVGLYAGMPIADSGSMIPPGTTISSIVSGTTIMISANATGNEVGVTGTASPEPAVNGSHTAYFGALANDSKVTPIGGPVFESYVNGDNPVLTWDKNYAMNTIYSQNLVPHGTNPALGTSVMPSINDSNSANANYEQNIGDLLGRAGVSWKWYSGGWNYMLQYTQSNPSISYPDSTQNTNAFNSLNATYAFQWHHQPFAYFDNYAPFSQNHVDPSVVSGSTAITGSANSAIHLQDEANFYSDCANNTLPSVCFIKPVGANNEHPGYATLANGMAHVQGLLQAVQQQPSLWAHTLIIITYDEHGGRWDHVAPPHRDIWGPGVRVPCVLISPYARQGFIDDTQYDTSSILSTIEARFLPPGTTLNSLDANAPTFINSLTNTQMSYGAIIYNKKTRTYSQAVTITNNDTASTASPVNFVLDNLTGATVSNATGTTTVNAPLGSPYIVVPGSPIAAGGAATVTVQFSPTSGPIYYTGRIVTGTATP